MLNQLMWLLGGNLTQLKKLWGNRVEQMTENTAGGLKQLLRLLFEDLEGLQH